MTTDEQNFIITRKETPSTHWDTCWQVHFDCAVAVIRRQQARIAKLEAELALKPKPNVHNMIVK